MGEYVRISKYKTIFAKGYIPNWSKVFVIKKVKNTVSWTYVISDLNGGKIIEMFYEKELQKANQEEFWIEKELREKEISYMLNRTGMILHLIAGLIKKTFYKMGQYFPKPYEPFGGDINVKVDLSNYATKADLKGATGIDTSNLTLKSNLGKLKAEIGRCRKN